MSMNKEKVPLVAFVVICLVTLLADLMIVNQVLINRVLGKHNQAYMRVVACVTSVSPTRRTPEYVQDCYNKAEKSTGTQIDRYGDAQ